jgi:hypothetical protein
MNLDKIQRNIYERLTDGLLPVLGAVCDDDVITTRETNYKRSRPYTRLQVLVQHPRKR